MDGDVEGDFDKKKRISSVLNCAFIMLLLRISECAVLDGEFSELCGRQRFDDYLAL